MPIYSYKARDKSGKLYTGEQEANNRDLVAARLIDDRLIPVFIEEINPSIDVGEWFKQHLPKKEIPLNDMVLFCRQMHALSKSGIPIMRAVYGLSETTKHPILKDILLDVGNVLSRGNTLSLALKNHEYYFSPIFINMVHVGESTGNLDQAFLQLIQYLEMVRETKKKVSSALRYPTIVISAICIAIIVVNILVIPKFSKVFDKFGGDLPFLTQLLLDISNFFLQYWWVFILFLIIGIIAFVKYINTELGSVKWDKFKLGIPIIGSLIKHICLSRFTRTFSLLTSSGVPILQGIEISSDAIGNLYIEQNIKEMRQGIERGESLSRTANASGMFTPLILQMISVGEESGTLDSLLGDVSDFYDEETDYEVSQLSSAIEPILLVFMGVMVLILALGIFLPLWDLNTSAR
ncbi:type II secretion system F family protein [Oceaniserpentilla sp. 4NH20-0058]|uniref:type II secretion system F family protein n=1 Tax=Oceaniserpentilla sp. 4NH20-0058 TaxID=3127660 RepID=UPI003109E3B1